MITRGFRRRRTEDDERLPPGQYLEHGFPVLSAGPTPLTPLGPLGLPDHRRDRPRNARGRGTSSRRCPREEITVDIHCVTTWTKLDTDWTGVSVDTLLDGVELEGGFVTALCDGGYTTNLPVEDVTGGKAWVAYGYDGEPLEPQHGGPARLLVPHLYFWKSAKWVRRLIFTEDDEPGFWETLGYHDRGDPWLEQRYQGD